MGVFHEILGDATKNDYAVGEPGRARADDRAGRNLACRMRSRRALSPAHAGLLRQRERRALRARPRRRRWPKRCRSALYAETLPATAAAGPVDLARARCTSPPTAGASCNWSSGATAGVNGCAAGGFAAAVTLLAIDGRASRIDRRGAARPASRRRPPGSDELRQPTLPDLPTANGLAAAQARPSPPTGCRS